MKLQSKSIQISFLIHAGLIALIVLGNHALVPRVQRAISIDLDVSQSEEAPPHIVPKVEPKKIMPKNRIVAKAPAKSVQPPPPEKVIAEIKRETPIITEVTLAAVVPEKSIQEPVTDGTAGGTQTGFGSAIGGSGAGAGISSERAKSKYLKEHFSYIRDRVLRNVSYPPAALRMGWQGKVVISFLILTDGSVEDVVVSNSSGFKSLDSNAVETVQHSAPFPKPPVEAQITIPIIYKIN